MPFEEGIREYQLKSVYPIHQSTFEYKGCVEIEIPKDAVVFYPFLDYLYEAWGMENIRLREQDNIARYEKAEVDRLVYEKQSFPTGMSPNEVAKKLGLSVQSVYKYIQDGSIKAEAVPYGDERTIYVISETCFL